MDLGEEIDRLAKETQFSGVVLASRGAETVLSSAHGMAHRGYEVPNTVGTRFAIASGTKGFTALVIVSLIVEGLLLRALSVFPQRFPPGERFVYNNGGYAVLAIVAARAANEPFERLVRERVCAPAGMADTAFLRSDELPGRTATGYLESGRTNVFSTPVVGFGDGGIFSTAPDFRAFWPALAAGRIVPREWVARMTAVHSASTGTRQQYRYGLGFWLPARGDTVLLEGYDYGVSFRSTYQPSSGLTCTVLSNTAEGAWPMAALLEQQLAGSTGPPSGPTPEVPPADS